MKITKTISFVGLFLLSFLVVFVLLNFRPAIAYVSFWFFDTKDNPQQLVNNDGFGLFLMPVMGYKEVASNSSPQKKIVSSDALLSQSSSWISIPSLNVKAPIIFEKSVDPKKIYERLEDGVVHYSSTPLPGDDGVSVILGHSSAYPWYKGNYGSVFALLDKLNYGDEIRIYKDGKQLIYGVSEALIFSPFSPDTKKLEKIEQTNGSSIVLLSCWPVGSNTKRIAVKADLL